MTSSRLIVTSDTPLTPLKGGILWKCFGGISCRYFQVIPPLRGARGVLAFIQAINFQKLRAAKWSILLFLATTSFAQPRLQPSLDLAQLQDREHGSYLEIYYAVPRGQLTPARNAAHDSLTFALVLDLRIYREQALWTNKTWKLMETIPARALQEASKDWVDVLRYALEVPGNYRAVLAVRDLHQLAQTDSAEASLQTRAFTTAGVELSDVLLASDIRKAANSASALNKNGYEILANPRLIYGEAQPTLFYYFEAYNLNVALPGASYKSYWHVENENGVKVEALAGAYRTKQKPQTSSVELGTIDVAGLPTGVYTLAYGIADSAKNVLARRRKKFYVYHGAPALATPALGSVNLLARASVAELDEEFNRMQHITQPEDKKLFFGLNNAEAKRAFIMSLWDSRKPEEYTAGISFRQVYLARAKYAEVNFPSALRPGWKGEQGRVYILYGPPSQVERETSNPNTKPYEIWRYDNLQGGVIFVFDDRTGFKNYELIHSTHRS
ncbi:MAG: GWxTD domain-containing protein, partial [candidate division KSB1 bacterium]